jgi:hypothetical protein
MSLLTSGVEPSRTPSPPLEHRLAPVIDTDRASLGAVLLQREAFAPLPCRVRLPL